MAEILHKPTVVDFLDQAMMSNELGLQMEEAVIAEESPIAGRTVMSSSLRQKFGVIIVGIKKLSGRMVFNPGPEEIISAGDVIVVISQREKLSEMSAVIS